MAAVLSASGRAARDIDVPATASARELVVFEAPGCVYCAYFRRDVLPGYLNSQRAAEVPIRFVDVEHADALEAALASPLTIVPTVVLLEEGREVNRITGYPGPENFFQMVSRILP
jgi:thioredoxin-related protein